MGWCGIGLVLVVIVLVGRDRLALLRAGLRNLLMRALGRRKPAEEA